MKYNNFKSLGYATNILRLVCIAIVFWGEFGSFYWSLSSCTWPVVHTATGEISHILLLSDPQIRNSQVTSLYSRARIYLDEVFLKKSWKFTSRLKPNIVFVLGDILANGKAVKDEKQFDELVKKFNLIFSFAPTTSAYFLPGNNDIGMGHLSPQTRKIRGYFEHAFGPLNQVINVHNHSFMMLDAPNLVDEDYQRAARALPFEQWEPIPGGAVDAVKRIGALHLQPLILLSHIPLYRRDGISCGPLREKGTIYRGVGHGYQNTLGKQTSNFLLRTLHPTAIFSGDNRDYCEYLHPSDHQNAVDSALEVTVKSFSTTPQIRRPGFQMLSIGTSADFLISTQKTFAQQPCHLPDRSSKSTTYLWSSVMTLCFLLFMNVRRIRQFRINKSSSLSLTPSPSSSNHTSPLLQDEEALSPIWSPHSPFIPISPRLPMPSSFRTPMAPATPTFRASSRPMTPQGSPMLNPQMMPPLQDEEDTLFPDKYTVQRDARRPMDEEWTPVGREDFLDVSGTNETRSFSSPSRFISAPNMPGHHRRRSVYCWSWSFVLRERRRRITLAIPTLSTCWSGLQDVVEILKDADRRNLLRKRRGILPSTLLEGLSVFWPASVVWLTINFWMF